MKFKIWGHENTLALHNSTIEFTKETHLTKRGDCILGINADFSYDDLIKIVKRYSKAKAIITTGNLREEINFDINKEFDHQGEIVIRRSNFCSDRTLGINCDKVALQIDRKIVQILKDPNSVAVVEIKGVS